MWRRRRPAEPRGEKAEQHRRGRGSGEQAAATGSGLAGAGLGVGDVRVTVRWGSRTWANFKG